MHNKGPNSGDSPIDCDIRVHHKLATVLYKLSHSIFHFDNQVQFGYRTPRLGANGYTLDLKGRRTPLTYKFNLWLCSVP